ncbi:MAG TPA: hypothetical protein VHY10_08440 [Xanthobacteraceae bacterium]|nr:hypothetical protein [Xanthobacteraceae bacterium]
MRLAGFDRPRVWSFTEATADVDPPVGADVSTAVSAVAATTIGAATAAAATGVLAAVVEAFALAEPSSC